MNNKKIPNDLEAIHDNINHEENASILLRNFGYRWMFFGIGVGIVIGSIITIFLK